KRLLMQVTQSWNLQDDLAKSSPRSSKEFLQQLLEEARQYCPRTLCLHTKILRIKENKNSVSGFVSGKGQLTILPAPQSASHPVPLNMSATSDVSVVADVACNAGVLQAEKHHVPKDQLVRMATKCIEDNSNLLSHSSNITKFRIKENIQRMKQNLTRSQTNPTESKRRTDPQAGQKHPCPFPQILLPRYHVSRKPRYLMEDMSSTEVHVEMKEAAYKLKIVAGRNEKPLESEIEVKSPGSNSACPCDLSVSEDDLLIEVSEEYRLHLNLPESVHTEMTTAKFIKENATLIIPMFLV
uniref:PIH1D1/2/3 CS-like domain-containing protein n=1 Tax=Mustela putorius furo TaxID=9669 RepID=M3YID5_MUSPF